jgi:tetratricopeptide (TPR) repeat protein
MNYGFYTYLTGDTSQFRKADRYLAKVNLKTPNYSDAWYYRGLINFSLDPENKTYLAQPYFQKVIDLYSTDSTFQKKVLTNAHFKTSVVQSYDYLLSYTSLKLKDNVAARAIADKLIALDPNNRDAQIFLQQKQK